MMARFIIQIQNILKHNERRMFKFFEYPPRDLAIVAIQQPNYPVASKFSLKDIIGDGFLMAVPKSRRTVERRMQRKFGIPEYIWKPLVAKTNIKVCNECGHHQERGTLCGNCYNRVEEETKAIQEKIQEKLGTNKPIEHDIIVLYDGESLPNEPKEFWRGKRIIEMKKERPSWFSKNLLQKTTQQPSDSTDVKPTDLA